MHLVLPAFKLDLPSFSKLIMLLIIINVLCVLPLIFISDEVCKSHSKITKTKIDGLKKVTPKLPYNKEQ